MVRQQHFKNLVRADDRQSAKFEPFMLGSLLTDISRIVRPGESGPSYQAHESKIVGFLVSHSVTDPDEHIY